MTELQYHRGPDDGGTWVDGHVGLGHRRLAILDLSPAGHQPMQFDGDRLVLTFNGEIYNYIELRRELQGMGYTFRSESDTEVLLAAYSAWGRKCVERFRGMWAFAIWDRDRRQLFCSRDPFGIKPLFFIDSPAAFCFASDIRALLLDGQDAAVPDWSFLLGQLSSRRFRRTSETSFQNIRALEPGCNLVVSDGGIAIDRYWDLNVVDARALYDYSSPTETFRELLADSVRMHFRSDVPVGVCLSGGLDSSAIVALAPQPAGGGMHTFSIVYPGERWSEDTYIQAMNERYSCRSTTCTPDGALDFVDTLHDMVLAHGEPDQGIGVYSQWKVMELARGSVTVLLDGQGGDELLAGYPYFYATYIGSLLRSRQFIRAGREYRAYREFGTADLGRAALKAAFPRLGSMLERSRGDVNAHEALSFVAPRIADGLRTQTDHGRARTSSVPPGDMLAQHLYQTMSRNLLQSLLYFEDRNSMAFSLEARVPFLDRRLVEFCHGLEPGQLLRDGYTKRILRDALRADLPDSVLNRRDKKGYPTPFSHWLRSGLMPKVREVLLDQRTRHRGVLDCARVEKALAEHESGRRDHSVHVFNWLVLELWFRHFHDRDRPSLDATGVSPYVHVRRHGSPAFT